MKRLLIVGILLLAGCQPLDAQTTVEYHIPLVTPTMANDPVVDNAENAAQQQELDVINITTQQGRDDDLNNVFEGAQR